MSVPSSKPSASSEGTATQAEGQESLPLRDETPSASLTTGDADPIPPAYNPESAMEAAPAQIPLNAAPVGQRSIADPAAPIANISEGQQTPQHAQSIYPAGTVFIPMQHVSGTQQVPSGQHAHASQYPGTVYVMSSQPPQAFSTVSAQDGQPTRQARLQLQAGQQPMHPMHPRQQMGRPGMVPVYVQHDDPSCLYLMAVVAFFIPIVGLVTMCVFNCGSGLGPRQAAAFRVLTLSTMISILLVIIIGST